MNKLLVILILYLLLGSCDSANRLEDDKAIISQKKYNETSGDCDSAYSNNCAQIKIEYPQIKYPQNQAVENQINEKIESYFLKSVFNANQAPTIDKLIEQFFGEYNSFKEDFPEAFQRWELDRTGKVKHNGNYLLSVELTEYSYLGGAHPNTYVTYAIYDLRNGSEIKLKDLFVKNYEETLNKVAEEEFRNLYTLTETDDLGQAGFWFENNEFQINDNYLITDSSLIFYYNNYEITAYAFGPTELEILYHKIEPLIRKNGLLSWVIK